VRPGHGLQQNGHLAAHHIARVRDLHVVGGTQVAALVLDRQGEIGEPVIDAIPISGYDMVNFVLTCEPNFVIPYLSWLNFQALIDNEDTFYVVGGDFSSTHSQLDRQSEDLLIEYVVLRLLRLQSAAEPTENQLQAEQAVLDRLAIAYRRYRPSVVPIVWQQRLRNRSWFWGGRGPY